MKAWDPGKLPPVEAYRSPDPPPPPRELTPEEKIARRRDYRRNHEQHSHVDVRMVHEAPEQRPAGLAESRRAVDPE